jgi:nicotinate-nucleotide adenylyltransferase
MAPASDTPIGRSRRVGIFGGTFDPPHNGHASAVGDVYSALDLDEVVWVPARRSPFKRDAPATPDAIRLEMVRAATAGEPHWSVSEVELRRPAPSFTVDTLRTLHAQESEAEYFLIIGVDQYLRFDDWKAAEEIRSLATLAVMDREGASLKPDALPTGVLSVPVARIDVSSTEVREKVGAGADIADAIAPGVGRIIASEGLYLG